MIHTRPTGAAEVSGTPVEKRKERAKKKAREQDQESWVPPTPPTVSSGLRSMLDAFTLVAKKHGVAEGAGNAAYAAEVAMEFDKAKQSLESRLLAMEFHLGIATLNEVVEHYRFTHKLHSVGGAAFCMLREAWENFGCTHQGMERIIVAYHEFVTKWVEARIGENSANVALGKPVKLITGIDPYDTKENNGADFLEALDRMTGALRPIEVELSPTV